MSEQSDNREIDQLDRIRVLAGIRIDAAQDDGDVVGNVIVLGVVIEAVLFRDRVEFGLLLVGRRGAFLGRVLLDELGDVGLRRDESLDVLFGQLDLIECVLCSGRRHGHEQRKTDRHRCRQRGKSSKPAEHWAFSSFEYFQARAMRPWKFKPATS